MELRLIWPDTQAAFQITEGFTSEHPAWFCPERGLFSTSCPESEAERILFYWLFSLPVIVNRSRDYLCRVGTHILDYGQSRPLLPGLEIQIGQYRMQVQQYAASSPAGDALAKRVFSSAMQEAVSEMPEDLLPHIGHYMAWRAQHIEGDEDNNPLNALANEYKSVVLWGEQGSRTGVTMAREISPMAPESGQFLALREQMEKKTVTDCILDTAGLMTRVCEELDLSMQGEIVQPEAPKHDILLLLAPPHLQRNKPASHLSSLMPNEFYKAGLDTLL